MGGPILLEGMELLRGTPARPSAFASLRSIPALAMGLALVAIGVALGVRELSSDTLVRVLAGAAPGPLGGAAAILGWGLGLLLPVVLVAAGTLATRRAATEARRTRGRLLELLGTLPDDHLVALDVALPDGRILPVVVAGETWIVLLEALPPPDRLRHAQGRWELRLPGRGWVPVEEPVSRARRDADRLRGWLRDLTGDGRVPVRAALVDPAAGRRRSRHPVEHPEVPLLAPDQVGAWLAALPAGPGFASGRRARLRERLAAATVG